MSDSGYSAEAVAAVEAITKWQKETGAKLPADVWTLPADCPIWGMDLTAFQAAWALARVRRSLRAAASPDLKESPPKEPEE